MIGCRSSSEAYSPGSGRAIPLSGISTDPAELFALGGTEGLEDLLLLDIDVDCRYTRWCWLTDRRLLQFILPTYRSSSSPHHMNP